MTHDERVKHVAEAIMKDFLGQAYYDGWIGAESEGEIKAHYKNSAKAVITAVFETIEVTDEVINAFEKAARLTRSKPGSSSRHERRSGLKAALSVMRGSDDK